MDLWAGNDVAELNGLGVGIHVVDDTCRYHLGQPSRGLLARTFAHIDDAQDMELLRLLPILVQRALAAGKRGGWGGGWSYELGGERVGCRDGYGGGGAQRGGRNAAGEGKGGERVWGAGMGTAVAEERKEEGETQRGRAREGGGGDPGGADIYCSRSDARRSLLGRYHRVLHPAMSGSSGALIQ